MRVYAAWALAASWATLAVAIPASPSPVEDYSEGEAVITGDKAFSLSLTENSDYQGKDAPSEMLKVRAKYGGTLSPELSEAVEINPDMRDKYNKYLKKG